MTPWIPADATPAPAARRRVRGLEGERTARGVPTVGQVGERQGRVLSRDRIGRDRRQDHRLLKGPGESDEGRGAGGGVLDRRVPPAGPAHEGRAGAGAVRAPAGQRRLVDGLIVDSGDGDRPPGRDGPAAVGVASVAARQRAGERVPGRDRRCLQRFDEGGAAVQLAARSALPRARGRSSERQHAREDGADQQ